ncbi:hypothetical protein ABZO31_12300 [Streptomyces sp. HUAS MG47]|uniref:hypothetical protein n=1 Tax=Streptomyces solicamelliae TaxID=3231716 RepID=UPI003878324A
MHADIHRHLHDLRAAELHREADSFRCLPRTPVRARLGWRLVEWGLRLAAAPAEGRRVVLAA